MEDKAMNRSIIVLAALCPFTSSTQAQINCETCPPGANVARVAAGMSVTTPAGIDLTGNVPVRPGDQIVVHTGLSYIGPFPGDRMIGAAYYGGTAVLKVSPGPVFDSVSIESVKDVTPAALAKTVIGNGTSCSNASADVALLAMNDLLYTLTVADIAAGAVSFEFDYSNGTVLLAPCNLKASASVQFTVSIRSCPPAASSIQASFDGTTISTANNIWLSANASVKGVPSSGATIFLKNSNVTISSAKGNFAYPVPDGKIVFSPSVSCATTVFDGAEWVTTVPVSGSDEILLSALGIQVPADLKAATVTWSGAFSTDTQGISLSWKWSAAVYTADVTQAQYNTLGVKPTHTGACLYNNSDHAGTPETVKGAVVGGARGGGGSNFTGSWSGTATAMLCL
jgi:hypothetical protein